MRLYALGSNGSYQLGLGQVDDKSTPSVVPLPSEIDGIQSVVGSGGNHTLLLSTSGRIYAAGSNEHGQCGLGPTRFQTFGRADLGCHSATPIKLCAATWEASFFVTTDDRVIACGAGSKGELGLGKLATETPAPTIIPAFPPADQSIVGIAACVGHVIVVLSGGQVYGWGNGRSGQIGTPGTDIWSPRRISDVSFRATAAACGKDFSCVRGHADTDRSICMLGPSRRDRYNLRAVVPALDLEVTQLCASWSGVSANLPTGKVVGYGNDDLGQLPPVDTPCVKQMAAGSEHNVAITFDDRVVAWGWGKHGNCGPDKSGGLHTLSIPGRPSQVFAGCATTFVVMCDEEPQPLSFK